MTERDGSILRSALLCAVVFVSGGVLLGVEIAASRVMAPYFGSSLDVWASLIGVVLVGLSLGYLLGGFLADKGRSGRWLPATATLAGAAILAIPVLDSSLLGWVTSLGVGPRVAPLSSAVLLFGPASILLAMTTPIAVRAAVRDLKSLGRVSGGLSAVSTAGSISGTLASAFYLIPNFGTDQVLVFAAAIMVLAGFVLSVSEKWVIGSVVALVVAGAGFWISEEVQIRDPGLPPGAHASRGLAFEQEPPRNARSVERARGGPSSIYSRDSRYHRIFVTEEASVRYLRFDNTYQSGMSLKDKYSIVFDYERYMQVGIVYNPKAREILHVGLGAGSIARRMWRDFPNTRHVAVELDPVVVSVARRFFSLPQDDRFRCFVGDGRQFLENTDRHFDIIIVDTFFADSVPAHLMTREFVDLLQRRLRPGGVVVVNIIGAISGQRSRLFRSLYRTYASEFPSLAIHPVNDQVGAADDGDRRNIVLVAMDEVISHREMGIRARRIRSRHPLAPNLSDVIGTRWDGRVPYEGSLLLTDGFAPVDALIRVAE